MNHIITLTSQYSFYDLLATIKNLNIIIPETILFENAFPKAWLFVMDKTMKRKKKEKLTYQAIQKYFIPKNIKITKLNGSDQFISNEEYSPLLQEPKNFTEVALLQNWRNYEFLYYVEYFRENSLLPYKYKVYAVQDTKKGFIKSNLIRSKDENKNKLLFGEAQKIINALETNFNAKIYEMLIAIILFEIPQYLTIEKLKVKVDQTKEPTLEVQYFIDQYFKKKLKKPKLPLITDNTDRVFSQQLFQILPKDKCKGDFCNYILMDENRHSLVIRKKILDDFHKSSNIYGLQASSRVHENKIPYGFIYECLQRANEVVEIFKKNKIFLKSSNLHYQDEFRTNDLDEFPFLLKQNTHPKNRNQKYFSQKICENCSIIYTLLFNKFKEVDNIKKVVKKRVNKTPETRPISRIKRFFYAEQGPDTSNSSIHRQSFSQLKRSDSESVTRRISMANLQSNQKAKMLDQIKWLKQNQVEWHDQNDKNMKQCIEVQRMHLGLISGQNQQNFEKKQVLYGLKDQSDSEQVRSYVLVNLYKHFGIFGRNVLKRLTTLVQAKNEKEKLKRKKIVLDKNISEIELRQQIRAQIEKLNEEKSKDISYELSQSVYYFTNKFKHIRCLPKYKIDSKMQTLESQNIVQLREFPFYKIREYTEYPPLAPSIQRYINDIKIFIYNDIIALPYILLGQSDEFENLVVLFQDIFDSFTEFIETFKKFIYPKSKILLFNFPGQAYSFFNKRKYLDAFEFAEIFDSLLFQVIKDSTKKYKKAKNFQIKFIGLGIGGYIAQSYCLFAQSVIDKIDSILLINSMMRVDEALRENLIQYKQILQDCPDNILDKFTLINLVANRLENKEESTQSKAFSDPMNQKTISNLFFFYIVLRIQDFNMHILLVQSLNDNLIKDQTWTYETYSKIRDHEQESDEDENKEKVKIFQKKRNFRRIEYIDGAHSFWQQDTALFHQIIRKFLEESWIEQ